MHEASLMSDLMRKILTLADVEGAERVTRVSVWLGALSHMSPAHFAEHYREAAAGSCAADAALEIAVSDDIADENAAHVVLRRIEVSLPDEGEGEAVRSGP